MKNKFYNFARSIVKFFLFIPYGIRKADNSKVPKDGGLIVCPNHSSLLDPVFVAIALNRRLTFMAKKELFRFKPFGKLISMLGAFPVDRGHSDVAAIKTSIRLIKGGHAMLMFPQGKRTKKADGEKGKHGAVRLAIMTGAPILPVGVSEENKAFRKRSYVRIGDPIYYGEYKGAHLTDDDYDRLTDNLLQSIYGLLDEDEK